LARVQEILGQISLGHKHSVRHWSSLCTCCSWTRCSLVYKLL